ncbi:hypothetical protein Theba_1604 [Mesotoga prima MesG1.Ag.4.2]|uniref:Uncharacterized protein n=1 Tax=Mesotoga prima MesG1.Ag.4.2 TaxID=660470 RepID=I2F5R5_9BACT|nr:hypothetical protein Theba_1604 [Mesotoga prima MesG1.Ag.4.2]
MTTFDAFSSGLQLATWNIQLVTALSKDGSVISGRSTEDFSQRRSEFSGSLTLSLQRLFDARSRADPSRDDSFFLF